MNLNQRQETILKVLCAYLTITMLWPPILYREARIYSLMLPTPVIPQTLKVGRP